MPVILVDVNIEGHGAVIWGRLQSPQWNELTSLLTVTFASFREVGLDAASSDDLIWHSCQASGFYLLTSNRNEDSSNSLEATIRREGQPASLPVFTIPSPDRVYHNPEFLERVVDKLLNYLVDAENILGTGRLSLP